MWMLNIGEPGLWFCSGAVWQTWRYKVDLDFWFYGGFKMHHNALIQNKITLLRVIPTMTFIHVVTGKSSGILSDRFPGMRSGILSGISSGILPGISSGRCSGISSGRCSGISSGISSGICSGTSSGIPSGILSGISSNILSGISSGTLCGISFGVDTRGWGPAGNTGRGWSWLRSGREQEERRRGEETWRGEERRGEERRGEEEEEEQATDIKSNNPHLAGGEKY